MKVVIYGAGYVGCVSAACLAQMGHQVTAIDTAQSKVNTLRSGHSPILEPGLDELIGEMVASGRLTAETSGDNTALEADIAIVCVGTPSQPSGLLDTTAMERVFQSIGSAVQNRTTPLTVVVRSTILAPVLRQVVESAGVGSLIHLVNNPEFLRETTAIEDFFKPPMIVVGGDNEAAMDQALELYGEIEAAQFKVSLETASIVKYACNAFHATKISFANEIDTVASLIGADGQAVMKVVKEDRVLNISPAYLRPGFAFGGSCLPKDLRALEALGRESHEPLPLLSSALPSNRRRLDQALETILAQPGRQLAVIGLSFKKGSDDLRESPYVELAERLLGKGFEIKIFDPDLDPKRLVGANKSFVQEHLPHLAKVLVGSAEQALPGATGVVLCKGLLEPEQYKNLIRPDVPVFDLEGHGARHGLSVPPLVPLVNQSTS